MKLVFVPSAVADLEDIADWIAKDNPDKAATFVSELRVVCGILPELPRAFPLVPRYEMKELRRLIHGEYVIFYRVMDGSVEVRRILNAARDYEPILFPQG